MEKRLSSKEFENENKWFIEIDPASSEDKIKAAFESFKLICFVVSVDFQITLSDRRHDYLYRDNVLLKRKTLAEGAFHKNGGCSFTDVSMLGSHPEFSLYHNDTAAFKSIVTRLIARHLLSLGLR